MIVNLTTYSDAAFNRSFAYKTSALVAIDLTGVELHMHVRAHAADATVFLSLSNMDGSTSNIVVTDAVNGLFTISIPYAQLTKLPVGVYDQSLIMTNSKLFNAREDIWRGTLTHLAGPTRWGSS